MAKVKQIGSSISIDVDVGDEVQITVNNEEQWKATMDTDMNMAVYLKRRNKPNWNQGFS